MSYLDPTDIHAQEKAAEDELSRQRFTDMLEVEDFKWLMSDKRGRRFMWALLDKTGVFRTSFTGNSTTFFNEGQRAVGSDYMNMINEHCIGRYAEMIAERKEHDLKRNNDRSTSNHTK